MAKPEAGPLITDRAETPENPEKTAVSDEMVACLKALSEADSRALAGLRRLVIAWANLPGHIRQAILTLVDSGKKGR